MKQGSHSREALTSRERQVLGCLERGECNKEIADQLGCTRRTVAFHVSNILRKTGHPSRWRLIAANELEKVTASVRPVVRDEERLVFEEIRIDPLTHRTSVGGVPVDLTRAQVLTLLRLLQAPGVPVSCAELRTILGALSTGAVHKQVARLRARLGAFGERVRWISQGPARSYLLM